MVYTAGITLKLKENVESKLRLIIPLLQTMNREFSTMNAALGKAEALRATNRALSTMARNLTKVTNAARGLPEAGTALNRLGNRAEAATRHINALGRAMSGLRNFNNITGELWMAGVGVEMIGGAAAYMAKPGLQMKQLETQMKMAGWSQSGISRAEDMAEKIRKEVPGISIIEAMGIMREAKPIFADEDKAIKYGKPLARAQQIINAASADIPDLFAGHEKSYASNIVKVAEMMGAVNNPKRTDHIIDSLTRAVVSSSGLVTPDKLQQQLAVEGPGRFAMDFDRNLDLLVHKTQETSTGTGAGRGRAGMQMAQQFRSFITGVAGNTKVLEQMVNMGFIQGASPGSYRARRGHGGLGIAGADIKEPDLMMKDPLAWMDKYVVNNPLMGADFKQMDTQKQMLVLAKKLGALPKNAFDMAAEEILGETRKNIMRQIAQRYGLEGPEGQSLWAGDAPSTFFAEIGAAWEALRLHIDKNVFAQEAWNHVLEDTPKVMEEAIRGVDKFNKLSEHLAKSSNDVNKIFTAMGAGLAGLWNTTKFVLNMVGTLPGFIVDMVKGFAQLFNLQRAMDKLSGKHLSRIQPFAAANKDVDDAVKQAGKGAAGLFTLDNKSLAGAGPGLANALSHWKNSKMSKGGAGSITTGTSGSSPGTTPAAAAHASKFGLLPPPPAVGGVPVFQPSPLGFGERTLKGVEKIHGKGGSMVPPPMPIPPSSIAAAVDAGLHPSPAIIQSMPPWAPGAGAITTGKYAKTDVAPAPPVIINNHMGVIDPADAHIAARKFVDFVEPELQRRMVQMQRQGAAQMSVAGGGFQPANFSYDIR